MVKRPVRGFTLMEVVMVLAIFGILLMILVKITADMAFYERKYPVNFMAHPQIVAVVSRLRRDVADTSPPYYPPSYGTYTQGPKTLILEVLVDGGVKHVVWDFSQQGEVHRVSYNVGEETQWLARGVPDFQVLDFPIANKPDSVRIQAHDAGGRLAIDQIFQPRPH